MKTPLVLGVATTTGVGVGLALGPFLLGWGLVVASAVAAFVFAFGLRRDPGEPVLRDALFALALFVLGFVASSVPLTLDALARLDPRFALDLLEPLEVETADAARGILVWRWGALGAVGVVALGAAWWWRARPVR